MNTTKVMKYLTVFIIIMIQKSVALLRNNKVTFQEQTLLNWGGSSKLRIELDLVK